MQLVMPISSGLVPAYAEAHIFSPAKALSTTSAPAAGATIAERISQRTSRAMSERQGQAQDQDEPWVNANWVTLTIKGPTLADTEESAKALAQATGASLWRYQKPGDKQRYVSPEGDSYWDARSYQAHFDRPDCNLESHADTTELTFQLAGYANSLEDELTAAAAFTAAAWQSAPDPAPVEVLEIFVAMGADRPPPGMPDMPDNPLTDTIGVPSGTYLQHSTWWEKDDEITEDDGFPHYAVSAKSITGGPAVPDQQELTEILMATYTRAAMRFLGMELT